MTNIKQHLKIGRGAAPDYTFHFEKGIGRIWRRCGGRSFRGNDSTIFYRQAIEPPNRNPHHSHKRGNRRLRAFSTMKIRNSIWNRCQNGVWCFRRPDPSGWINPQIWLLTKSGSFVFYKPSQSRRHER